MVLSFFADGPKWENFVYLPAYPSGCSYFRPFRYRDKWIEKSLLGNLKSNAKMLDGRDLVVGARFHTAPWEWSLLPLRRAKLTHFGFNEGEDHDIYFCLGEMVDFRDRQPA